MHVYFCPDIVRVCRMAQRHPASFCVDVDLPGATKVPGIIGSCESTQVKKVCEYGNEDFPTKEIQAVIINKFNLNIIGGVLAACGNKPEDEFFWQDVTRYAPSHREDFYTYPEGVDSYNVDRIRAFDLDLSVLRRTVTPQNSGDVMQYFSVAGDRLRYIMSAAPSVVQELAQKRIEQMGREWRGLSLMGEKQFTASNNQDKFFAQ